MLFTRAGGLVAWVVVIYGLLRIALGVAVIQSSDPTAAAARYLGSGSGGAAIDKGIMAVIVGICIGVLVEISKSIADKNR